MLHKLIIGVSLIAMITACTGTQNGEDTMNPLLVKSDLPFEAPDFSKIKPADYLPAFEVGFKQQNQQIDSIINQKDAPTFENTIVALEKSGKILKRTELIFFGVVSADGTDELRKIQEEISPKMAAHSDEIFLNKKLFERIKTVYDAEKNNPKLTGEDARLLEETYKNFIQQGANLPDKSKDELKKINTQLAELTTEFSNKVTKATDEASVLVSSKDSLEGLSEQEISAAAAAAKNAGKKGYLLKITNTTQQPQNAFLKNRAIRQRLFEASVNRATTGNPQTDTRELVKKIVKLRAYKAKFLGYPSYAAWSIHSQMAQTPQNVYDFLNGIIPPLNVEAKKEAKELQNFAIKEDHQPADFKLQAWDWSYYVRMMKEKKFDLNANLVREYFDLDSVLKNGVFYAANKMYGLTFKERNDIPVYNPDVKVYTVYDKDGKEMALFYTDYFQRPTKDGGAWMSNFVNQSYLNGTKPVIYNVCNFTKPQPGQPPLLSFDEVETMFHEFGHALHGLFASQKYESLSGTSVPRDFVEAPSQFNEHWATEPSVFANYARNYKTGEPMPKELVKKVMEAKGFMPAYGLGENIGAVTIDLAWHSLSPQEADISNVLDFEKSALEKMNIYNPQIPPRYHSTYFRHIFAGGYAAGYYAYLWTEVIEDNFYEWFKNHGGMTSQNADRFREMVLSKGNTEELSKVFTDFTGLAKPDPTALLKNRGIVK